jgi:predicted transcriptional regulator of viral defense system
MPRYKDAEEALFAIATRQSGYFTARQALVAGYAYPEHTYHTAHGNWLKVARGIYRLRNYPSSDRDDLVVLFLQSIDRSGQPQGVFSHETALALHELSDANPARIHITLPPRFRKHMPDGLVIHRATLSETDWQEQDGYRLTTPLRTLVDIAASPSSISHLEDAVRDALRRGLVRRKHLRATTTETTDGAVRARLLVALDAAEQRVGD